MIAWKANCLVSFIVDTACISPHYAARVKPGRAIVCA